MAEVDIDSAQARERIATTCRVRHLLMEAGKRVNAPGRDFLRVHDLSEPGSSALWELEEPLSSAELARRMECQNQSITPIADRLVAHGWIERVPHPSDRRITLLTLTTSGRRLRTLIGQHLQVAYCLANLSDEQLAVLEDLLNVALAGPAVQDAASA